MAKTLENKLGANRQTFFFKHCDVSCLKSMLYGLRGQKLYRFNKKMFETMFEQVHNLFKQMKSFYWPLTSQSKTDVTKEDVTLLLTMFGESAQTIKHTNSGV